MLAYQAKSARHVIEDSWRDNLDTSLLYRKWPHSQEEDSSLFRTLTSSERPAPGTPVGIDAEFVALQQEELEIKADGSRSTLRPSRLGLARVSVLRGSRNLTPSTDSNTTDYTPFIDDYIHISDPIIDYLTAYSGISPGDLSPRTSPHAAMGRLVSLKQAYKKIWLLLNLGCVFVGHGLPKDFRTINIHVPRAQVVDTVDLFYLKARGRKLSLRFLSWLLLGERVQTGMHDSVEDARMALRLWDRWQGYEAAGVTEQVLHEVYARGRDCGFRVPDDERVEGGLVLPVLGHGGRRPAAAAAAAAAERRDDEGSGVQQAAVGGGTAATSDVPAGREAGLVVAEEGMDGPNR